MRRRGGRPHLRGSQRGRRGSGTVDIDDTDVVVGVAVGVGVHLGPFAQTRRRSCHDGLVPTPLLLLRGEGCGSVRAACAAVGTLGPSRRRRRLGQRRQRALRRLLVVAVVVVVILPVGVVVLVVAVPDHRRRRALRPLPGARAERRATPVSSTGGAVWNSGPVGGAAHRSHRRCAALQRRHVPLQPVHLLGAGRIRRVDGRDADQRFLQRRDFILELSHGRDAIRYPVDTPGDADTLPGERRADVGPRGGGGGGGGDGRVRGHALHRHTLHLDRRHLIHRELVQEVKVGRRGHFTRVVFHAKVAIHRRAASHAAEVQGPVAVLLERQGG